jgi:hypothetical protein
VTFPSLAFHGPSENTAPLEKCTQIISIKNKTAKQNLSMKETTQQFNLKCMKQIFSSIIFLQYEQKNTRITRESNVSFTERIIDQ